MSIRNGRTRRCSRLAWLAATALSAIAVTPTAVQAQARGEAAREYSFDIPAQSLARSLTAWAQVTGYQMVWPQSEPATVETPALRGRMTAEEALGRLTAGTGFTWEHAGARTIRLRRLPAQVEDDGSRVLGPVRVEGAQSAAAYDGGPLRGDGVAQLGGVRGGQDEEATGYRANVATVGAGAPVALEDIPRSISVLTQAQLQAQSIQSIGEAIQRLPGVTMVETAGAAANQGQGASLYARGAGITQFQIDGGAPMSLTLEGNGAADLAAYERVELVRGPNGLFSSAGSAGGVLNLVRKRPGATQETQVTAVAGSFDRGRVEIDYSTPQVGASAFAFRGVIAAERQNYFYDNAESSSASFYGIVDAPLGDKARLELGAQASFREDEAPYSGLLRFADGPLIPLDHDSNLTADWAYDDARSAGAFGRLYVDVMEDIDLEVGFDVTRSIQDRLAPVFRVDLVSSGFESGYTRVFASADKYDATVFAGNFRLTGRRSFLGLDHNFFVGGDLTDFTVSNANRGVVNSAKPATIEEFITAAATYQPVFEPVYNAMNRVNSITNFGLVLGDVISWRDRVELTVGARRNQYLRSAFDVGLNPLTGLPISVGQGGIGTEDDDVANDWSPTWSLGVKPLRNLTIFGTAAEGQERRINDNYTADGDLLPPEAYENLELGAKYATGAWLASVSYYENRRHNTVVPLYGTSCLPSHTTSTPCYEAGGDVTTTGVDFEIAGEVLPGLNLIANYAHARTETEGGVRQYTFAPVDSGSLFVDWRPETWPRWSFRGGLRHRSEVFREGFVPIFDPDLGYVTGYQSFAFSEDPYWVVDAGLAYRLTDTVTLDLFAENLTDEQYISTVQIPGEPNLAGAPRTFTLTLRWNGEGAFNATSPTTGRAPFGDPADWYAAVEAGAHFLGDLDAEASGLSQDDVTPIRWTFETEDRFASLVRLGYRFTPSVRGEIEAGYRRSEIGDIGGGAAAPFGVCGVKQARIGTPFDCDDAQGDADNWSLMANVLYDFGDEESRVRPFLGAGLGLARTAIDFSGKMEGIGGTTWINTDYGFAFFDQNRQLQEAIGGDTVNYALAGQLIAGLAYRVTDRATLEASYRYYAAPEVKWDSWNLSGQGGFPEYGAPVDGLTNRVGEFSAPYNDQSVMIAFRWAFGAR